MQWNRIHYSVLVVLILLFGAVTVSKHWPESPQDEQVESSEPDAQRTAIEQFWSAYRQATRHRMDGHYAQAAAAYEHALAVDSTHEDALYYLGHVYAAQRKLKEATAMWARLVKINPNSARGHTQLGELFFCFPQSDTFDLDMAKSRYEQALDIHNEETRPLVRLATIALIQGRVETAQRYVKAVRGSNEKNTMAPLLGGYLAWKQGDVARASVMLARASSMQQGDDQQRASSAPKRIGCPLSDTLLNQKAVQSGPRRTEWIQERYERLERQLRHIRKREEKTGEE